MFAVFLWLAFPKPCCEAKKNTRRIALSTHFIHGQNASYWIHQSDILCLHLSTIFHKVARHMLKIPPRSSCSCVQGAQTAPQPTHPVPTPPPLPPPSPPPSQTPKLPGPPQAEVGPFRPPGWRAAPPRLPPGYGATWWPHGSAPSFFGSASPPAMAGPCGGLGLVSCANLGWVWVSLGGVGWVSVGLRWVQFQWWLRVASVVQWVLVRVERLWIG